MRYHILMNASGCEKVIFLLSQNDIGGNTKFVLNLARELNNRGYQCEYYVPYFSHFYYTWKFRTKRNFLDTYMWLKYFVTQIYSTFAISKFKWRGEYLGFEKITVKRYVFLPKKKILDRANFIFSTAHWDIELLLKLGINPKKIVHVIHHLHSNKAQDLKFFTGVREFTLTVSSEATGKKCIEYGIQNFTICNLGVDTSVYTPANRLRVDCDRLYVGFFYYDHPRKNPRFIETIVEKLLNSNSRIEVYIFGNGFKHFDERINVIKGLDEIAYAKKIANLDIFVYISILEGFALPPLEAMASGVPVISSNVGAVDKYMTNFQNGLILNNSVKAEEVLELITYLLNEQKIRKKISKNGLASVQNWTWAKTADTYYQLLQNLFET